MTDIVIHDIDVRVRELLGRYAAHHGRTIEDEARAILHERLGLDRGSEHLVDVARALFGGDGVDLEEHPRVPFPKPVDFESP